MKEKKLRVEYERNKINFKIRIFFFFVLCECLLLCLFYIRAIFHRVSHIALMYRIICTSPQRVTASKNDVHYDKIY